MSQGGSNGRAFFYLKWPVAKEGYTVLENFSGVFLPFHMPPTISPEGPILVANFRGKVANWPWGVPADSYEPTSLGALHRNFAQVKPNAEGMVAFANQYGLLARHAVQVTSTIPGLPYGDLDYEVVDKDSMGCIYGEPLINTEYEITKMRVLIDIADLVHSEEPFDTAMSRYWLQFPEVRYCEVEEGIWEVVPPEGYRVVHFHSPGMDQCKSLAPFHLPYEMSRAATKRFHKPEIPERPNLQTISRWVEAQVNEQLRIGADPQVRLGKKSWLRWVPQDLLTVCYVHFALELTGQAAPPRKCPSCCEWFEPIHLRHTYDRESCKQKAKRTRKQASAKV